MTKFITYDIAFSMALIRRAAPRPAISAATTTATAAAVVVANS